MRLFFITTLAYAPLWILLVLLTYALARWSLGKQPWSVLPALLVCVGCLVYGLLRFHGIIAFADDTCVSYHWFGSSSGDQGYQYISISASVLLGIGIAFLNRRRI